MKIISFKPIEKGEDVVKYLSSAVMDAKDRGDCYSVYLSSNNWFINYNSRAFLFASRITILSWIRIRIWRGDLGSHTNLHGGDNMFERNACSQKDNEAPYAWKHDLSNRMELSVS